MRDEECGAVSSSPPQATTRDAQQETRKTVKNRGIEAIISSDLPDMCGGKDHGWVFDLNSHAFGACCRKGALP